jgi:hypothetical protein
VGIVVLDFDTMKRPLSIAPLTGPVEAAGYGIHKCKEAASVSRRQPTGDCFSTSQVRATEPPHAVCR